MADHLDVFISSTSIDLPEYRKVVLEAILTLGLHPLGMEHWPVTGKDSVTLCRDWVNRSELFVGIYAYRYGWCPDDVKSITEMEYEWATERNIPRFCFVMHNDHPFPKSRHEDNPKAQAKMEAFKSRVKGDLQVGFFTTPDDLKAQVIAALAPYSQRSELDTLIPYLRWLNHTSKQSGLLRVMDARRSDPTSDAPQITVDKVYTPLDVRKPIMRDGNFYPIVDDSGKQLSVGHLLSQLTAMEAATLNSQLALLGDPGSGKSTFVGFLTLALTGHHLDPDSDWLEQLEVQGWTHGASFPVFITLRDFAQDMPTNPTQGSANLIWEHLGRELGKRDCADAVASLKRLSNDGKLLVLFDGLDEVPNEKRVIVRDSVAEFMHTLHSNNRIIVTCRILSYTHAAWKITGLVEETIAPFDADKINHFIETWYNALLTINAIDGETAEQRIKDLTAGLQDPKLQAIASNPMLLTVMALVHNHTGTLPRETARLYEECVALLMLRWKPYDAKTLLETLDIRQDDLYRMLWEIAYDAHDKQADREGAADIAESDVIGIARKRLNDLGKAGKFAEYIEQRAGLLVGRGQNADGWRVFTFPHRTFQEYLAGCFIATDRFNRRAPELAKRGANWRETLLLATGNLVFNRGDVATPLDVVNILCPDHKPPHSEDDWRVIALAGEMLALIGVPNVENDEFVGKDLLPRMRERLGDLLTGGHLPPIERAAAGRTLAVLGDPRRGVGVNQKGLPDILWCSIPAGDFFCGSKKKKYLTPMPYAYEIAKYPVTNAQFQPFLDDPNGYHNPEWWTKAGWEWKQVTNRTAPDSYNYPFNLPNHPRVGVSFDECIAFSLWLTAQTVPEIWMSIKEQWREIELTTITGIIRLPTIHEWEKAARGIDGRFYPWGNELDRTTCNILDSIDSTSAVGIFPQSASPYQVEELVGNAWEWFLSTKEEQYEGDAWKDKIYLLYRHWSWKRNTVYFTLLNDVVTPVDGYIDWSFRLVRSY